MLFKNSDHIKNVQTFLVVAQDKGYAILRLYSMNMTL